MINVTTIKENVIQHNFIFTTTMGEAESAFVDLVIHNEGHSPDSDDLNCALDDGYFECVNGVTVCISHPETNDSDTLKEIRNEINKVDN